MDPVLLVFVLSLATVLLFRYHWKRRALYKLSWQMDGPIALPIVGSGHLLAGETENVLTKLVNMFAAYKHPMRFWLGPQLILVFTDLDHVQKIMSSTKITYKSVIYSVLDDFVKDGLVSGGGQAWRDHRRMIQPMFNLRFVNANIELMEKHVKIFLQKLESHANGVEFDCHEIVRRCAFDIIGDVIFDLDLQTQNGGSGKIYHAFEAIYDNVFAQMVKPWIFPKFLFKLSKYNAERKVLVKTFRDFSYNAMDLSAKRVEAAGGEIDEHASIIDQMTKANSESGSMTRVQFSEHILTLCAASEDTAGVIGSIALLCLGMYPEYQELAAKEVKEVMGGVERDFALEDLLKLKYLDMCIKDVIRLTPIAPFIIRRTVEEFSVGEITIPEGCEVLVPAVVIHRNPEQWTNPDHFHPDHFLPEATVKRHPYASLNFSAGPRSCIGKHLALQLLKLMLAHVLLRYRIEADGKFPDVKLKTDISIRAMSGYKIRLFKRT